MTPRLGTGRKDQAFTKDRPRIPCYKLRQTGATSPPSERGGESKRLGPHRDGRRGRRCSERHTHTDRHGRSGPRGGGSRSQSRPEGFEGLGTKTEALLVDEAPITEIDELRPLIAEGQERGFLTIEQIAASLEEVEVTKEQVAELHAYLLDQGIEVLSADGRPVTSAEPPARSEKDAPDAPRKPEIDLTVEPSLDSLRLYLRSIGKVSLLTADREVE